jgi:hypothetical protein
MPSSGRPVLLRIGMHCGPVMSGVVGSRARGLPLPLPGTSGGECAPPAAATGLLAGPTGAGTHAPRAPGGRGGQALERPPALLASPCRWAPRCLASASLATPSTRPAGWRAPAGRATSRPAATPCSTCRTRCGSPQVRAAAGGGPSTPGGGLPESCAVQCRRRALSAVVHAEVWMGGQHGCSWRHAWLEAQPQHSPGSPLRCWERRTSCGMVPHQPASPPDAWAACGRPQQLLLLSVHSLHRLPLPPESALLPHTHPPPHTHTPPQPPHIQAAWR